MKNSITGFLFDIYNIEEKMYIWILDQEQRLSLVCDVYYPVIYADGPPDILRKLVRRLVELDALYHQPRYVEKIHFYENRPAKVLELVISRPSVLYKIKSKLFALYGKMDIYHSDLDPVTGYLYGKNLYPIGKVRVQCRAYNMVDTIVSLEPHENYEYEIPPLRVMRIFLKHSHRLGISEKNPVQVISNRRKYELPSKNPVALLRLLNRLLIAENPDVIVSLYGDQLIFPFLFHMSQKYKIPLELDRDNIPPARRQIKLKGSSFNTYGSWIYRAPSYPLFGRWHIDAANSFVYKESGLYGVMELARLSRIPAQKVARSSTGSALTSIETGVGIQKNYLIPWQKSAREEPKTWYELLQKDKGGLIFQPDIIRKNTNDNPHGNLHGNFHGNFHVSPYDAPGNIRENVAQLDFSQMYPSIMNLHNISPETVNCPCCAGDPETEKVPELNYHICRRRRGVVSDSLLLVLDRRRYFKNKKKTAEGFEKDMAGIIVDTLKWINVVSFGYLGFRNAKFGKLESHESVTAHGRDKLLMAMNIAENHGFDLSHAITDCIFIHKTDFSKIRETELNQICEVIFEKTGIEMSIEGIYSWIIFCPSKTDPLVPVANRYLGRFENGQLKYRGIAARRKDTPEFIKQAQLEILLIMKEGATVEELKKLHARVEAIYIDFDNKLSSGDVPWKELLLRKTVSHTAEDYTVDNATALSLKQLKENAIDVQPGEKVRYLVVNQKAQNKQKRYLSEEMASQLPAKKQIPYDKTFYRNLLLDSYREVWEFFAPENYFESSFESSGVIFNEDPGLYLF